MAMGCEDGRAGGQQLRTARLGSCCNPGVMHAFLESTWYKGKTTMHLTVPMWPAR